MHNCRVGLSHIARPITTTSECPSTPAPRRCPAHNSAKSHPSAPRCLRNECDGSVVVQDWQTLAVPSITGRLEVNLTVPDPARSAVWYAELFGMEQRYAYRPADSKVSYLCLGEPDSGLILCLVGHTASAGDLSLNAADLHEWAARLDDLGIPHSGVNQPRIPRMRC